MYKFIPYYSLLLFVNWLDFEKKKLLYRSKYSKKKNIRINSIRIF